MRRPRAQSRGRKPGPQHPGVAGAGASHLPQQPGVRGRPPGRVLRAHTLQRGGARAPDGERRQGPVHLQQPPHVGRGQESVGGHGGRGGPGGRGTGRGGGHGECVSVWVTACHCRVCCMSLSHCSIMLITGQSNTDWSSVTDSISHPVPAAAQWPGSRPLQSRV